MLLRNALRISLRQPGISGSACLCIVSYCIGIKLGDGTWRIGVMKCYVPDVGMKRAYADIRTRNINSSALLVPLEEPPHDVLE
jgi:hypothetical protein